MSSHGSIRKTLTAMLMLAIALWAEAGLALVAGDQVMECSMTMHRGQAMAAENVSASEAMPCCPEEQTQALRPTSSRPECCTNGDSAERPLGFVVSSERHTLHSLDSAVEAVSGVSPQNGKKFWNMAERARAPLREAYPRIEDRPQNLERASLRLRDGEVCRRKG